MVFIPLILQVHQCKGWKDPSEWKLLHIDQLLVFADGHLQGETGWVVIYKLFVACSVFCFMLSDRFMYISLWLLPTHHWQTWSPYSDIWLQDILILGIRVNIIKLCWKQKSRGKTPLQKETDMSRELIKHWKNYHVKQAMNCTRTHEPWLRMENKYFQKELKQTNVRASLKALQDIYFPSF